MQKMWIGIACVLVGVLSGQCAEPAPRNVVFILADDLGAKDLSGEGSSYYESPSIDRIAREGMRFRRGYANCQVCSPSRASIMTGQVPARHGITEWIGAPMGQKWKRNTVLLPAQYEMNLDSAHTTLAEALQEAGYTTFFAGKWHLGSKGSWPQDHGFDINVGGWDRGGPAGGYFAPYRNPQMTDGPAGESLPLRLGQETARFIRDHQDEPFLAYLSFYSVHGPIQTTQGLWQKYQDKAAAHPHAGPRFRFDRTLPVRQVQDNPIYAGMMEAMDQAVGLVLQALVDTGLDRNTIVVFTSDNGGVSSGDAFSSSNLPLRGGKGRQWEGGIREPYYIKVPGMTPPGSTCTTPVAGADFYPTLLELAGLPLRPEQHVDGVSLVPLLQGGVLPSRDLFWHYPHYGNQGGEPSSIIMAGDWKLIHYWEDGRDELYHVMNDIGEQENQSGREPDRVAALRQRLDQWLVETGARLPVPNPNYDAAVARKQLEHARTRRLQQLEAQHARYLAPDFKPNADWWGSTVD